MGRLRRIFGFIWRLIKYSFISLLCLYLLVWLWGWGYWVNRENIVLLKHAKNVEEVKEVASSLFAGLPDGSWLAIRYRDTHSYIVAGAAAAIDSEGHIYTSTVHYCGRLGMYRVYQRMEEEARRQGEEPNPRMYDLIPNITGIMRAPDLATAREYLLKLGFSRYE